VNYYAEKFAGSWAQTYLVERVGVDLTGNPHVQPGYAPAGWTNLVNHLRQAGVTDLELTESGLATTARNGRVIDRFRDRLVFPITRTNATTGDLEPLGFVGRRHPKLEGKDAGPKYLNTPETALFHKGAQLHIVREDLLADGATPVLVEGPMDALAVSIAARGDYVGLAPLGTSLTEEQAAQLAQLAHVHHSTPVVATDADLAGQLAAQRDYWLLTQHGLTPQTVRMRPGSDPADILALNGAKPLHQLLQNQHLLAEDLLAERLSHLEGLGAARAATRVLAADHPTNWSDGVERIAQTTGVPPARVRRELVDTLRSWSEDPRTITADEINDLSTVRTRLSASVSPEPIETSRPHAPRSPHPAPAQGPAKSTPR